MAFVVPGQCDFLRVSARSDLPGTCGADSRGPAPRFKQRPRRLRSRARPAASAPEESVISLDPRTWSTKLREGAAITFLVPPGFALARADFDWVFTVFVVILVIVSLGVHEAAHAWTAWKLGDSTAKDLGRMTINPIVHIDPFMTILLPVLCALVGAPIFGGAKPVPVAFHRLRNPWVDMAVVAFAGPLSNLILAGLFFAAFKFFVDTGYYNGAALNEFARQGDLLPRVMMGAVSYNVMFFVFNLIPIPPLDGSRILVNVLPVSLRESYYALGQYGLFIIYALFNYWAAFKDLYYATFDKVFQFVQNVVTLGGKW